MVPKRGPSDIQSSIQQRTAEHTIPHLGGSDMRRASIYLITAVVLGGAGLSPSPAGEGAWVKIFNGKNLEGWEQRNGDATYRVDEGAIVGTTGMGNANSFLCTKKEYGDFELKFEVKLVHDELNSGVQIRSKSKGNTKDGRVHGPQVEIAADGKSGYIYGEALDTGWITTAPGKKDPEPTKAFKNGAWNKFHVKAAGKHLQTWINGEKIVDFMDEKSGMNSGFIGLQVHAIPKGKGPYEVRWKNLEIKELTK
jgi:hypothetical protein